MIDVPGCPSEQYTFTSGLDQNYDGCFPCDGEYEIPRPIDTSGNQRQAHHKPEQLWSREDNN